MSKPPWMLAAEKEIGQKEIRGGENPRIVAYHQTTSLKAREDEVPWCASFVNWCLKQVGVPGTNSAAAASFLKWGDRLVSPKEGCIIVLKQRKTGVDKKTGSASGYHVGFFVKTEGERVFVLGGNQSDSVKISSFGLGSYAIAGFFWPKEAA